MKLQQTAISHGRLIPQGSSRADTPNRGINAQGLLGRFVSWLGFGEGNIKTTVETTTHKTTKYLSKKSCFNFLSSYTLQTTGKSLDRTTFMTAQTDEQIIQAVQLAFKNLAQTRASSEIRPDLALQNFYIRDGAALDDFYKNKGIITGKEPIQVDIEALGLDLNQAEEMTLWSDSGKENKMITLRMAAMDVINEINKQIEERGDDLLIKERRRISILKTDEPFKQYSTAGLPNRGMLGVLSEEDEKQIWMNQIIQALINKGHIHSLIIDTQRGYGLQA